MLILKKCLPVMSLKPFPGS